MNQTQAIQIAIGLLSVLGAIAGGFYGVRVGLARVEEQVKSHERRLDSLNERVNRLEHPFFTGGNK